MYKIKGSFKFKGGRKISGDFALKADSSKKLSRKNWKPITWKGHIDKDPVEVVQLCVWPRSIEDFEWSVFPEQFEIVKAYIAMAIEEKVEESKDH